MLLRRYHKAPPKKEAKGDKDDNKTRKTKKTAESKG